tara:strand:- start:5181 stop:5846 length:666 start_codon:yes stop_codon:yes gene_type:complete
MKKTIFNAIAIFISIIGSFAVERYISKINDQNSKEILASNILYEIDQNYYSLLEVRTALQAVVEVTDSILLNWKTIDANKIKGYYVANQYALRDDLKTILSSSPPHRVKKMYFNSLINSGLILEINNQLIREKIESIYNLINYGINSGDSNSNKIRDWFNEKQLIDKTIDLELIFNKNKDFHIYKLLIERRRLQIGRLYGVENSIDFFEEIKDGLDKNSFF